jgi:hypothetical protein
MPSSISSSNHPDIRPGLVRQTASDRPGVAQPVPERTVPERPWNRIAVIALVLMVVLLAGWEMYWRDFGAVPGYQNDEGQWAQQRRRIDNGEGDKAVLIGSSRTLFDVQIDVWEKVTGVRPIQLALEGTSAMPVLEDLAADVNFTGKLLIGVSPDLFFTGFAYRGSVIPYYHKEGPSQKTGHWLSQRLVEPYWAFYDSDFQLDTVIRRQAWPPRPGMPERLNVRKLMVMESDRNSQMWSKVVDDPEYRALARRTWKGRLVTAPRGLETPDKLNASINKQIDRAVVAINTLRARGVRIVFFRAPSIDDYYDYEQKYFSRASSWDVLLKRTGVQGIHFEDYPQLQTRDLPEWSHMSAKTAREFSAQLAPIVEKSWNTPAIKQ